MRKKYTISLLLMMAFFTYSCTYNVAEVPELPTESISFNQHLVPIFEDKCVRCHGSSNDLDLTNNAYDNITNGNVEPGNPNESLIYTEPHPDGSHFAKYSIKEAEAVSIWIIEGAENN